MLAILQQIVIGLFIILQTLPITGIGFVLLWFIYEEYNSYTSSNLAQQIVAGLMAAVFIGCGMFAPTSVLHFFNTIFILFCLLSLVYDLSNTDWKPYAIVFGLIAAYCLLGTTLGWSVSLKIVL